jgi:uncharacterized protein YbjT (DUF2867 family)
VAVLTEDGHDGRCYTITGPEAITFGRVAEVLAAASGRPVRHVEATVPQHRAYFARSGRPDDLHKLTGNPPRSLETYAREVWAQ